MWKENKLWDVWRVFFWTVWVSDYLLIQISLLSSLFCEVYGCRHASCKQLKLKFIDDFFKNPVDWVYLRVMRLHLSWTRLNVHNDVLFRTIEISIAFPILWHIGLANDIFNRLISKALLFVWDKSHFDHRLIFLDNVGIWRELRDNQNVVPSSYDWVDMAAQVGEATGLSDSMRSGAPKALKLPPSPVLLSNVVLPCLRPHPTPQVAPRAWRPPHLTPSIPSHQHRAQPARVGERLTAPQNARGPSLGLCWWVNNVLGAYEWLNEDHVHLAHSSVGVLGLSNFLKCRRSCSLPRPQDQAAHSALLTFILHCYGHTSRCSAFLVEILHSTAEIGLVTKIPLGKTKQTKMTVVR